MSNTLKNLNCMVCDKNLEIDDHNQIIGATIFPTHGNYGSTFIDNTNGEFILVVICDKCLRKKHDFIYQYKRINYVQYFKKSEYEF